ncbi:MAG TPA: ATP-binding protein [Pyrinomonadaceae bacterium]|jgi:signal transduction histidine kinase
MSLLEIIQLVGYALGAALPLWLSLLLARQRRRLAPQERVLLALAISIGLWHTSNLFIVLRALLGLDAARWVGLLRAADTAAVVSITFAYSFLLHVHLHLWAGARARPLTRFEGARVYLSYVPTLFLLVAVPHLWTGAYAPMLTKLSFFVLPFGLWATYVLGLIAGTDILIARMSASPSERRLMLTLAGSFVIIAALLLSVYALGVGRDSTLGVYLVTLGNLSSLLPTALIAYHVYRYRYLELIIKESLVAAAFAAVILVVYLYGIRTVETWLTGRYQLRAGVVEALLILAFALSAAPLRGWLERRVQRLFAREAALYREVVARIGARRRGHEQLPAFLRFIEARTAHELALRRVRFYLWDDKTPPSDNADGNAPAFLVAGEQGNGAAVSKSAVDEAIVDEVTVDEATLDEATLDEATVGESKPDQSAVDGLKTNGLDADDLDADSLNADSLDLGGVDAGGVDAAGVPAWVAHVLGAARDGVCEATEELRAREFELAFVLERDEQVFGLMLVDAPAAALTPEVRAVLSVLARQVALAVEDARLVEANVLLERKLAQGERLAALGQMAAAVAHEVKNPLSSIKSIAQVMREDERVAAEYGRDLDLIVGETDRLGRSVTQLLSFARQPPPAGPAARADELARALVELFRNEARARSVRVQLETTTRAVLAGAQAAAARDALSNLLLNALQATPPGGRVLVEARDEETTLCFAVTDEGGGVPADLRERIWEPFFTTRQRGTGLGLAIVRKRMNEAGGSARLARSRRGAGARFELRLPAVAAELPVEPTEAQLSANGAPN